MTRTKYFFNKYILLYTALAVMALAGCSDAPDSLSARARGIRITVANGEVNPRTALPAAEFTGYELRFSNGPAGKTHSNVTLQGTPPSAVVNDLAAGTWTVTAVGYVTINKQEYAAAEGTITVTTGAGQQEVTITLKATQKGADGYFSYTVNYPDIVQEGKLLIYPFGESETDGEEYNLLKNKQDTISLSPGHYVMHIRLSDGTRTAGVTEIVHIYANMETKGTYRFGIEEFIETITLSGTIDTGGIALDSARISTEDQLYNGIVNLENNQWSLTIPYDEDMDSLAIEGEFQWNDFTSSKKISQTIAIDNGKDGDYSKITLPLAIKVTNTADGANQTGTLRQVIQTANENSDSDIIVIDITDNSIALTGSLEITSDITIIAKKAITITRNTNFTGTFFTIQTGSTGTSGTLSLFGGKNGASITLDGGKTQSLSANAALITVNSDSILVMNDGVILQNNTINGTENGGGVYVSGGTFTMEGGTVSDNAAAKGGGVLVTSNGTFTMKGNASLSGNAATIQGGGVFIDNGTFIMQDNASVSGNNDTSSGGGGVCMAGGTFTMKGGTISNNSTTNNGGGVDVVGGTFTMNGGTISNNSAVNSGGGVYVNSGTTGGTFTKTGGTITGADDPTSGNVVKNSSGTVKDNSGHAVYVSVTNTSYRRENTAGPTVNLDSTSATGGWDTP